MVSELGHYQWPCTATSGSAQSPSMTRKRVRGLSTVNVQFSLAWYQEGVLDLEYAVQMVDNRDQGDSYLAFSVSKVSNETN
jgi:hypothetical protein